MHAIVDLIATTKLVAKILRDRQQWCETTAHAQADPDLWRRQAIAYRQLADTLEGSLWKVERSAYREANER